MDKNTLGMDNLKMSAFVSIGILPQPVREFPKHEHTTWEIILYTHGTGIATVGDTAIPFAPGTIICMPPYLPHGETSAQGYRNLFIHARHYPRGEGRVPTVFDRNDAFRRTADLLYHEFNHRRPGYAEITGYLFGVMLTLLRRWDTVGVEHPEAVALREMFDRQYADPQLTAGRAMAVRSLSANQLRKQFAAATGLTPNAYLTAKRLNQSQMLLSTTGMTVRQCAEAVGFADSFYFSKCFKRAFGVSPAEWAKRSDRPVE